MTLRPIAQSFALGFTAWLLVPAWGAGANPEAPATGKETPTATFQFTIQDPNGTAIPGRLTFTSSSEPGKAAFRFGPGLPDHLAVRKNVVATASGHGRIAVEPGRYTVTASRGPEWSIDRQQVTVAAGEEQDYRATLRREIETGNWIGADLHLHTREFSGHSDASVKERLVTLRAEDLDLGVATDHDHATDYRQATDPSQSTPTPGTVIGAELTSSDGHFNVFPLEAGQSLPGPDTSAPRLIGQFRSPETGAETLPLIQVNHPRSGSAYFNEIGLDPVTGEATQTGAPGDFDLLEVLNRNEGFGYFDANRLPAPGPHITRHWALGDWFNLLNRGHRYTAVGNSDSHTVTAELAGYPRNYVWTSNPATGPTNMLEIIESLRNHRSFISLGPFVEFSINGMPVGSEVVAPGGQVRLALRVQAASWVDVDRVQVVINGDIVEEIPVPQARTPLRLETTREFTVPADSWIALRVEGDDSLVPVVPGQERPVRPLAVTNPIWVKTAADRTWNSPWSQAQAWASSEKSREQDSNVPPAQRALRLLAASERPQPALADAIRAGLVDPSRPVRLAAARATERTENAGLSEPLQSAYREAARDPYARVALLRALAAVDPAQFERLLLEEAAAQEGRWQPWGDEIGPLSPEAFVRDWWVAAFFAPNGSEAPRSHASTDSRFPAKGGTTRWQKRSADASGFVSFITPDTPAGRSNGSVAYAQVYLYSPGDRQVPAAIGSDDGFELFVNGERIASDARSRRARPWQNYVTLPLRLGWNRIVMKVRNGMGDFGFYFQLFDEEVDARLERRAGEN